MSPEPPGPRVFGVRIRSARVPTRYHSPANITKYGRETNPSLWLDDYRLHAELARWRGMISSSATSPSTSRTQLEPGSSTFRRTGSTVGRTYKRFLLEIYRARTNALGTPGTSRAAGGRQESPYGTTSGGSLRSAMSSPT